MRHSEYDMKVAGGEKFALASCEPMFTRLRLALGAVPVPTRVIGDGLVTALRTGIDMTAQRSRAAALNGAKGLELLKVKARRYRSRKRSPCARRMSATSTAGRLIFGFVGGKADPTFRRIARLKRIDTASQCRRDKCK